MLKLYLKNLNHPLKDYEDILKQYNVKLFAEFEKSRDPETFIAGTVMSVKEKKTAKGNSFAIVKFSDLSKAYELFLFAEILEKCHIRSMAGMVNRKDPALCLLRQTWEL